MTSPKLKRLAAFTIGAKGGNPAGVWVGKTLPEADAMQRIAAQVGFSETAFIAPTNGYQRTVRYFSPLAEIAFCGHATIASGVALGQNSGLGTYQFDTRIGRIPVEVDNIDGTTFASLTSVEPKFEPVTKELLSKALAALDWRFDELNESIPAALTYAGNWHLVIAVKLKRRLDDLSYNFDELKSIMLDNNLTTLQLIYKEQEHIFHSRNPFPIGGVIEDPATGSAALALGGYLRAAKLVAAPIEIDILQGEKMGRPSLLKLYIPTYGGIRVSGTAVELQQ